MARIKNRNITIKIIAVFFAVILWTYVMSDVNPKITKEIENIKVELINLDTLELSGITLMEPKEVTVKVKLSGRRKELIDITADDIIAQADLSGYKEGSHRVDIEVRTHDSRIEVEDYYPKQAVFKFDKIVQKQKPIMLRLTGKEGIGYSAGKGIVKPSTVYIKGPRTWVNSVTNVIAYVNLDNSTEDIITSVPLKAVNDRGNEVEGITKEPNIVDVEIPILKMKDVPIKPQIIGSPLIGYEIINVISEPDYIKIRGSEEVIKDIKAIETEPVNVDYIAKSIRKIAPLVLPEGIEVVDENDSVNITVEIEKKVEKTFEFNIDEISFNNLDPELEIDKNKSEQKLTVTFVAVESTMNLLTKDDIELSVDLTDLKEGLHNVDIEIKKPSKVEIIKSNPKTLKIYLKKKTTENSTF
ncbi:CdaR family protein [Caloranaerobacter ferrireducens]|uniref:CdaR family protein n=1 Tax=Caloranaerobacter ferrireducens TaxID=1323370 RepID=UPI00084D03CE|nr:CdaR family protein [Caloranaerobacter ferrireducens]